MNGPSSYQVELVDDLTSMNGPGHHQVELLVIYLPVSVNIGIVYHLLNTGCTVKNVILF